jgi:hypothetical protein
MFEGEPSILSLTLPRVPESVVVDDEGWLKVSYRKGPWGLVEDALHLPTMQPNPTGTFRFFAWEGHCVQVKFTPNPTLWDHLD